jgi:hypothetical protein
MKTLVFLLFVAVPVLAPAVDVPSYRIPGPNITLDVCTETAGLFSSSLLLSGELPLGGLTVVPCIRAGYSSLGSFQFIKSDDHAYQVGETVTGHSVQGAAGLTVAGPVFLAGVKTELEWMAIGEERSFGIRELAAVAGIRTGEFALSLESGFRSQGFYAISVFRTPLYLLPIPLSAIGSVRWTENLVLSAGVEVWNAGKDLLLSCEVPQGIFQPVDTLLEIGILKRFGSFEWGVRIKPSLTGNDRYETVLGWFPAIN